MLKNLMVPRKSVALFCSGDRILVESSHTVTKIPKVHFVNTTFLKLDMLDEEIMNYFSLIILVSLYL